MSYFFISSTHKVGSLYADGFLRNAVRNTSVTFACFAIVLSLVSCNQGANSITRPGAIFREETVTLPTSAPAPEPTPVNTRVLPIGLLTPSPSPTITPIPDEVMGLVVDVIDGDTIAVVLDGDRAGRAYQVRYLGIEAPENVSGNSWGVVAYETNQKLTKLKIVRLVRDQTDFDAEGYLLRYVYVDNQMLSITLAEQGLARAVVEEPNTRFGDDITDAEARAREDQLGLWGQQPPTPTLAPTGATSSQQEETVETSIPITPAATDITPTEEGEPTEELVPTGTITATVEITPEATGESTPTSESQGQ